MNFVKKSNSMKRTLPQEDLTVFSGASLPLNSSASPHEQSLHAFRLPVVAQTESIRYVDRYVCYTNSQILFVQL